MADKINEEILKQSFDDAGFVVKELVIGEDGICRIEWNYPDEPKGVGLRIAFAKYGAEVSTYYQYHAISEERGELLQRERAVIPFSSHEDLRQFFINVMKHYHLLFDDVGLNPQGTAGRQSSYNVGPGRVQRPLSA